MKSKGVSVYTKGDQAYIPSTVVTQEGICVDAEPVEIVNRWDSQAMVNAMKRIMDRGDVVDPCIKITRDYDYDSSIMKLYGYKTWKEFAKGTKLWVLTQLDDGYAMYAHGFPNARGAWIVRNDRPPECVQLGADATEEELLERFVAFINRGGPGNSPT